jgi:serine/threonine-protein kinase RsbW
VIYHARFPAIPAAVSAARVCVSRALRGRVTGTTLGDVELLTSELVTNSVRHAGIQPHDPITLHLETHANRLRLEISDQGPGFEPGRPEPSPSGENGWGLYMVDKISDRWGVLRNEPTSVWFEIDL